MVPCQRHPMLFLHDFNAHFSCWHIDLRLLPFQQPISLSDAFHVPYLSQLFKMSLHKKVLHICLLYFLLDVIFPLEDGLQCLSLGWMFLHLEFLHVIHGLQCLSLGWFNTSRTTLSHLNLCFNSTFSNTMVSCHLSCFVEALGCISKYFKETLIVRTFILCILR
jgi:hypothetical protein